ncbi:uncharacterized protein PEZ65_005936 [Lycodopsis pacificus]
MASVIELLLETLAGLSHRELKKFKYDLLNQTDFHRHSSYISLMLSEVTDKQDMVFLIVLYYGQQSVNKTKEVLKKMNRTDLVQMLSHSSSGPKKKLSDEHRSALIQRVATIVAVKQLLLETLNDLDHSELKKFQEFLPLIVSQKNLPDISSMLRQTADNEETVDLMMQAYGHQSVDLTREVVEKMNRTDLMWRWSESSSALKGEHFVEKHQVKLIKRVSNIAPFLDDLLHQNIIQQDSYDDIKALPTSQEKMTALFSGPLESSGGQGKAMFYRFLNKHEPDLIHELSGTEVPVVEKMNRTDLMWRWSESSSALKATSSSVAAADVNTMAEGEHFVEKHQVKLIKRVSNIAPFLDDLLHQNIIQQDSYDDIKALPTSQEKMTALFSGPLESSGGQGKAMFYRFLNKHEPDLIHELSGTEVPVETMMTDEELLLETLNDLSSEELKKFKWLLQFNFFHWGLPQISWSRLRWAHRADLLVDVMMKIWNQQSVEVTKEVFMDMNRTDLVQRLSETSSEPKEKHTVDEHWPALIQKVETMASVIELLLETLAGLSDGELEMFMDDLWSQTDFRRHSTDISLMLSVVTDKQDMVLLMVLIYGQQSVNKTMEFLKKMNRTDLVQMLSHSSSGPKKKLSDEHRSALIQRVATKAAVKQLLLETLYDLDHSELKKFQEFLPLIVSQKNLPNISSKLRQRVDSVETVDLMMQLYGHQSVDLTREVVEKMNRTDLMWRWSKSSSALKEEHSVDEHQPSLSESEVTMTSAWEKLLETLEDLSYGELEQFKLVLQRTRMKKGLPRMSRQRMETADRDAIVEMMMEIYKQQSVEVTSEVLMEMNRSDLVKRLSDFSSGSKAGHHFALECGTAASAYNTEQRRGSLELEGCGSIIKDSSDWTKREPEVNSTGADEAPTYSLQSEAGTFECSVSGLRWICQGKVSFQYQFSSVQEHMERINSMQYMAAGPLMNITVLAGKLDEVHLPHWICIDDNPTILDKFAVLHIDDCGDVVEKVSEVTSSHVKLSEPVFSLKMVILRLLGVSVEINCNVLIYKTDKTSLTLDVYLIPQDPGLQQELDKRCGYRLIQKPHPEKSLKLNDSFILTTDLDGAEIYPEMLMLRNENPNFFEVFIDNPEKNFKLQLTKENKHQPVWTCAVRKDDYQSTAHSQGEHFVDKHRAVLIDRVSNIASILDELLNKKVITQEAYDEILAIPTNREKMRKLYSGPLNAAGYEGKEVFYKLLVENHRRLIAELKNST